MRKIKRISLALLLVVVMLVQSAAVLAAVSPVVYEINEDGSVTSYVFARDLTNGAKLYTAVYNADGSMALATASTEADKAGYLKTTVAKAEGQTVKSFLWDKSFSPFGHEAEYTEAIDAEDITITLNGINLLDLLPEGTVLTLGESYDVDIRDAGFHSTPAVRASSKNSQVESVVTYSDDYKSATVTFCNSDRILSDDAKTVTNTAGKSFVAERYTKAVSGTVTINFKKNYLTDDDLIPGSPAGGIKNDNTLDYHYEKDYTLADGETVKKISLNFASIASQNTVLIIEPKDASADKDTLVNSNGSAVVWEDDTNVVKEFDYDNYVPVEYGKLNKTVITSNIVNNEYVPWACKELLFGDNARENASRYLVDRDPATGGYQICGIDGAKTSELQGCNYIVLPSVAATNGTLEFYVGEDVTLHIYSKVSLASASDSTVLTVSDVEASGNAAWSASAKTASILNRRYQNSVDAVSVAWLIREGVLREEDLYYQKNNNVMYDLDGDGKKESWHDLNGNGKQDSDESEALTGENIANIYARGEIPDIVTGSAFSAYYIKRYDAIDYLIEKSGNTAGYGLDDGFGAVDIPNSLFPYYYSETYDYQYYLDLWGDWEYSYERAPLISEFNHASKFTVTDMPMSVISGEHKGETAVYTGDVAIADGVKFKIIDFFSDSITSDRTGLEVDANGVLKNQNATGALVSYPDGFGLEDATFICFTNGPVNDAGYCYASNGYYNVTPPKAGYHDVWVNTAECYEWYNFKVSRDAEVLVFATGDVKFLDNDGSYTKTILDTADGVQVMRNMNTGVKYSATRLYTAAVGAGETVTMKTPGNGDVLYCVFVKEAAEPEIDTTLASITVDGAAIEGFDPAVKEYSVEIADPSVLTAPVVTAVANDTNATVEVIPATDFPGSTKIVVNHINGGTDVYTVNHTYSADMISDLDLMDGVIPKTMFQWAIDAGKLTTYTSDSDYTVSASGNDRPLYFKNGMVPGTRCFNARDYVISTVNDASIYGKDVIIPSYSWVDSTFNVSEGGFISAGQTGGVSVENWVNFTIKRKATVKILVTNGSTGLKTKLEGDGYSRETDSNYYFVNQLNGTNVRNFNVMYSKTFEAGTVNIPNGYNTNDLYTIVIDYADYE